MSCKGLCLFSSFHHYINLYTGAASAPINHFPFFQPVLHTIFFPRHWLLSLITIVEAVVRGERGINPLPGDKILDWSKLKAFADHKSNVTQNIKVVLYRIENIVGKEENADNQHFLLFPECF